MSTYEIADELKVQADTVVWLLLHGKEGVKTKETYDVYVNWNPIGSSVRRLTLVGRAMADMVREATEAGLMEEPEVVAGIESGDRKSTRLNSSHRCTSYAVFCLKKKQQ